VAWLTLLAIWCGLSVVGVPMDLAMVPAALCAAGNLALLRVDARSDVVEIPDTVPAAWSGLDAPGA